MNRNGAGKQASKKQEVWGEGEVKKEEETMKEGLSVEWYVKKL